MLQTSSTFFFFCYDYYYLLPPTRTSTESVRTLYSTPTSFNMSKYASFPHYILSLLLLKAYEALYTVTYYTFAFKTSFRRKRFVDRIETHFTLLGNKDLFNNRKLIFVAKYLKSSLLFYSYAQYSAQRHKLVKALCSSTTRSSICFLALEKNWVTDLRPENTVLW
jgi:hypothetical protein